MGFEKGGNCQGWYFDRAVGRGGEGFGFRRGEMFNPGISGWGKAGGTTVICDSSGNGMDVGQVVGKQVEGESYGGMGMQFNGDSSQFRRCEGSRGGIDIEHADIGADVDIGVDWPSQFTFETVEEWFIGTLSQDFLDVLVIVTAGIAEDAPALLPTIEKEWITGKGAVQE